MGSRPMFLLLWVAPWGLVILGGATRPSVHTALWVLAFSIAGVACLVNARRCGRRHCFYTGPLFLLAALASLLYGLGLLPLGSQGWNWIAGVAFAACVIFCCLLEPLFGKYTTAR